MRVYLIRNSDNLYKIGYSKRSASKRIKELQTGSATELWIIYEYESRYARKIETTLHHIYSSYRLEGEWFDLPGDEVLLFNERAKKIEDNLKMLDTIKTSTSTTLF